MKRLALGVFLLLGEAGAFGSAFAQARVQACSNRDFCDGWTMVCLRGGAVSNHVCQQRRAKCISTGCFDFNVPRPRCKSNPEDLALTTSCRR